MTTICANGTNGTTATHGTDAVNPKPRPRGSNGLCGGDAGKPTPGINGGNIIIKLTTVENYIQLLGTYSFGDSDKTFPLDQLITLNPIMDSPKNLIKLSATGGDGGQGGTGGNGSDGKMGANGTDADSYSRGTNGKHGGTGGNGGSGSSGAAGGAGGIISVTVTEADMHLLALVTCDVSGGLGGLKGSHGEPGEGGSGGYGGDSYSSSGSSVCSYDSYDSHRNRKRGGKKGSNGRSGTQPKNVLSNGKSGSPGKITYNVNYLDGTIKTFESIYDVRLQDISVKKVYEFGQAIKINNVICENKGKMPSPSKQKILIDCVCSKKLRVVINTMSVVGLEPNHLAMTNGLLELISSDHVISTNQSDRGQQSETITFSPYVSGVKKHFNSDYKIKKDIILTYPIELVNTEFINCLCPGQIAKCFFTLENVMDYDLGTQSDSGRKIQMVITADDANVRFYDNQMNSTGSEPYKHVINIPFLGKYKVQKYDFLVGLDPLVLSREQITIQIELHIEPLPMIRRPNEVMRLIQQKKIQFKAHHQYIIQPNAKILLLIDDLTSKSKINVCVEYYESIGINVNIWDTSVSGFIDYPLIKSNFNGWGIIALGQTHKLIIWADFQAQFNPDKTTLMVFADNSVVTQFYESYITKRAVLDNLIKYSSRNTIMRAIETDNFMSEIYCYEKFVSFTSEIRMLRKVREFETILENKYPHKRFSVHHRCHHDPQYILESIYIINLGTKFHTPIISIEAPSNLCPQNLLLLIPYSERVRMYFMNGFYTADIKDSIMYQVIFELTIFMNTDFDNEYTIMLNFDSLKFIIDLLRLQVKDQETMLRVRNLMNIIKASVDDQTNKWNPFSKMYKINKAITEMESHFTTFTYPTTSYNINTFSVSYREKCGINSYDIYTYNITKIALDLIKKVQTRETAHLDTLSKNILNIQKERQKYLTSISNPPPYAPITSVNFDQFEPPAYTLSESSQLNPPAYSAM
jgi:hypothetical protein